MYPIKAFQDCASWGPKSPRGTRTVLSLLILHMLPTVGGEVHASKKPRDAAGAATAAGASSVHLRQDIRLRRSLVVYMIRLSCPLSLMLADMITVIVRLCGEGFELPLAVSSSSQLVVVPGHIKGDNVARCLLQSVSARKLQQY